MPHVVQPAAPLTGVVQPVPHMDEEGLSCFKEALAVSRCYLEYGSGGSTIYAANVAHVPTVLSTESDVTWRNRVLESISDASRSKVHVEYWDIGEVAEWGYPKDQSKIGNYWGYMAQPWRVAKEQNLVPDTVLIDGRFRVACFLFSLLSARIGTKILFDDYLDRPHYFVVEQFCQLKATRGRMGLFSATKDFSITDICENIAKYSIEVV